MTKPLALLPAVAATVLAGCAAAPPPAKPEIPAEGRARLVVEVRGLASGAGQVGVALFDSPGPFAAGEDPLRRAFLEPGDGSCVWTVDELPFGRYAVKAFHDENGNGELDFNALGAPSEPYGFSSGARGRFGPPEFEAAAFAVAAADVRIVVSVR